MILKYAIALAILIALAAAFAWAFLPARHLPGNRARHLRIRLHLRLHPGKGFAHLFSLWLRWGRLAALRRSGQIRPSLPLWYRIAYPGQHSVFLGRTHYRHGLRVPLEEHLLVMAPPRTYKTAFLADVILNYPGPVIATSTKADLYSLTSAARTCLGPVHVFNPQGIGAVASTFRWSPVDGCQDPATAIRRADAFAFAVSQKGVEDGTFWSAKASDYLRGYFCAAALARYDLRTVAAWVAGADPDVPERILLAAGAGQWAHTLAELRSEAHKTAATVRMVMSRSLAFMADPALAASVLPGPGGGFDIPAFLDFPVKSTCRSSSHYFSLLAAAGAARVKAREARANEAPRREGVNSSSAGAALILRRRASTWLGVRVADAVVSLSSPVMTTVPRRLNWAPNAWTTRVAAWLTGFPVAAPSSSSQASHRSVIQIRSAHSVPISALSERMNRMPPPSARSTAFGGPSTGTSRAFTTGPGAVQVPCRETG